MRDVQGLYSEWVDRVQDAELAGLLADMKDDTKAIEDAFFQDLSFGTAGLRGVIGAGTNRMNVLTVGRATQGLANYLVANFENPSVAIARDSRNKGELFVQTAASVLAANGVRVYVYPRVEPTPALSFAVRDLGCSAGINVTASHNPAPYNGYKVYGADGCQITTQAAKDISAQVEAVDCFADVRTVPFDEALANGQVSWIGEDTLDRFIDNVAAQSLSASADDPLKIVYTPLCGTGLETVKRILNRIGVEDITVVPEQAEPNGDFPTCEYPNPEARPALEKGIQLSREVHPDLLLATDPDADRVGVAVPDGDDYALITGNEMGVLLLDYIARMRRDRGEDLSRAVAITTIVSSAMVDDVAADYGFQVRRVLTGFKYIGEQIALLEAAGEPERYIFGFEESYGYLAGTYVRDKDAVVASMLICEMARYYRARGMSLVDARRALYEKYGYWFNRTVSLEYPGAEGAQRMADIMARVRADAPADIAGFKVTGVLDYDGGATMPRLNAPADEPDQTLPSANVVEYQLEGGRKFIVRPSGTEPKIKVYVFAKAATENEANEQLDAMCDVARELLA
ncbi:phospho-sugar mutase [Slackia heliotrinireducens]|uniref:Phosphomannomutase n=1 Tax=Slackia heliotrinireducens (strain ATCC 29202 / DSM 20476 / NCTC 11029 / RHS 1) TaxID=471855 RepID=C7N1A9_SLAHD|nr:phospho-sugar mutase [Slackia heliotrinireducens]ACV23331.1 phosphomannomutase [Slackia heliotrinireducens DSM 20476]VEH02551.1 Phosphoglucomutase [Slackia heliotrinireducens]